MMSPIWRAGNITLNTKMRLFNSNIKTILLYGCETWKTTKHLVNKLQLSLYQHMPPPDIKDQMAGKTNTALWEKTNQTPMESELKKES